MPTDINKAREKKAQLARKAAGKPQKAEIFHSIIDALEDSPLRTLPLFPFKATVLEPKLGTRSVAIVDEQDVVTKVDDTYLRNEIMQYSLRHFLPIDMTPKVAAELVETFKALAKSPAAPADVLWADEPGLTFRRLPWDKMTEGCTPTWDELMTRCQINAMPLMQFIGSLFEPASYRQQYLWIMGAGGDGKGAIIRFLERVMGAAAGGVHPPGESEKRFWSLKLLNIRLAVVKDIDKRMTNWPTTGLFKQVTGGDRIPMEIKGGAFFDADLTCKFVISSNYPPKIGTSEADQRRIIQVDVLPRHPGSREDPLYEEKLWAEGGAFLTKCLCLYQTLCPNHERIKCDKEGSMAAASVHEEVYEVFADEHFIIHPASPGTVQHELPFVSPRVFQHILDLKWRGYGSQSQKGDFTEYLRRRGVVKKSIKVPGKDSNEHRYLNISTKGEWVIPETGNGMLGGF